MKLCCIVFAHYMFSVVFCRFWIMPKLRHILRKANKKAEKQRSSNRRDRNDTKHGSRAMPKKLGINGFDWNNRPNPMDPKKLRNPNPHQIPIGNHHDVPDPVPIHFNDTCCRWQRNKDNAVSFHLDIYRKKKNGANNKENAIWKQKRIQNRSNCSKQRRLAIRNNSEDSNRNSLCFRWLGINRDILNRKRNRCHFVIRILPRKSTKYVTRIWV